MTRPWLGVKFNRPYLDFSLFLLFVSSSVCWDLVTIWFWLKCSQELMKGRQTYWFRRLMGAVLGIWVDWSLLLIVDWLQSNHFFVGESVGVLWIVGYVGRCWYHGPDDSVWLGRWSYMRGEVYMSHGRSLSLPGPHDTVDGAGVGPYLTVGSTIQLVPIWKTVVWLWFDRWPYNDLVEIPLLIWFRPVVVWEVVSWRDGLLWIVLDW